MDPQSTDKVAGLRRLTRRVASRSTMRRSWLWMFLGFCFLAAMLGGPARLAAGPGHGTVPAATLPHTLVAADTARIPQSRASATPQQIAFEQPPDATVGRPVNLTASSLTTASSPAGTGLPVSLRSDTPAVCTVSNSVLTPVAPGTCVITASQDGDGTYAPAVDVAHASQIRAGQTPQQINFLKLTDMTVGQQVRLVARAPGGRPVFRSDTPAVCTVAGLTLTALGPGTCVVTASQGGSGQFAPAQDVAQTFQVRAGQAPQDISFTLPADMTVGEMVTLSAIATSGLTATFRSDTPQVCRVSGSAVTPSTPGLCVITAVQGGSASYAPAHDVAAASQIHAGQATQDISFTPPAGMTVGEPVTLSASASSRLAVSFQSDALAVCTVSSRTVIPLAPGTCELTAYQGGSADYAPVSGVYSSPVTSGQRPQDIAFPFKLTQDPWVGAVLTLTASASSRLAVSFQSDAPAVCAVSRRTVILLAPGICSLTAYQGGSRDYAPAHAPVRGPVTFQVFEGKAGQTILVDPLPAATVGVPFTLWATASSGLMVVFSSDSPAVCTVSSRTVIPLATGTCKITAFQGGSAEFASASSPQSVQVGPGPQSIDFPQPPAITYGQSQTLTATASSGLPVTFTSGSTDVCTTSGTNGSTVTAVKTGTCAITATQPGDINHQPARALTRFEVTPAPQTIDFPPPPVMIYGQSQALTATTDSGLPVIFTSGSTDVCTVSGTNGSTVTAVKTGTCAITATQPGDTNHLPADPAIQQVEIGRAAQTIDFPAPKSATVDQPLTLTASSVTATSPPAPTGLPVTYTSDTPEVCTVSGATVNPIKAQECSITAFQPGDGNYLPARSMTQSFMVQKVQQTISFTPPAGATAGQPVSLGAKASSGLPVSYTSDNPGACPVSGTAVTPAEGGSCTITARQAGNDKYAAAQPVKKSFPVARIPQTMDFRPPPDTVFGKPVTLKARASSRLNVSFSTDSPDVCSVSGSAVTTMAVGTCRITARQAGNARYAPARDVARSFQVGKAPQTITFTPPDGATMGQRVTLSAAASSGLPVSFSTSTPDVCTVSGSAVTPVLAGTCAITASQGGGGKYLAAPDVPQSFPVHPGGGRQGGRLAQSITFGQPPTAAVGQTVPLSASASSGLEVSFRSDTPSVCTVSGAAVTTATVGACAVTASQAGDDRFRPARDRQRAFTVHARQTQGSGGGGNTAGGNHTHGHRTSQAIIFGQPGAAAVGQVVPLSASTTSGLAVSFSSDTPSVCTVAGTTVTTTAAGTCAVTASQAGDRHYLAAREIAQSFQVHAGHTGQTITFPPPPEATVGDPVTLSASASSGLTVAYRSDTPRTCTVSGSTVSPAAAGTCTVTASQGGSDRYAAARDVKQSFQVAAASSILPNALKFLLGAAVLAAAGVTALVRRVRRPHRPPPPQPSLRVAPDPGPPTLVSIQNTEAGVPHTVRLEPSPGASIITIKEAKP